MIWRRTLAGLQLQEAGESEIDAAAGAISRFARSGHRYAERTGADLAQALSSHALSEEVAYKLSGWCDSEGGYRSGVEAAREVAKALFNGCVPPRMTSARGIVINRRQAQALLRDFVERSNKLHSDEITAVCEEATPRHSDDPLWPATPAEPAREFRILGPRGNAICTVDEWFRYAPPAGGQGQWVDGRSAKELARCWCVGRFPDEIRTLLDTCEISRGFIPRVACAESQTRLDPYSGNTRNSDLVLLGTAGGLPLAIDIEGKADESFGTTIAEALAAAEARLQDNPNSKGVARIQELCRSVLGCRPAEAGTLRYQLLHGNAAAAIRARQEKAPAAFFVVHEFQGSTRAALCERNLADLEAFVRALGGDPAGLCEGRIVGPMLLPGGGYVPADLPMYIGKATRYRSA